MLKNKKRIIALTGAGISKESGIDTFMERPEVRDALYREIAQNNPEHYRNTIKQMKAQVDHALPNDAHLALAEYGVEIITMNIDSLHEKAGSKPLNLHGTLPLDEELDYCETLYNKPVLYSDRAPNYPLAIEKVLELKEGDVLLVIGASNSTAISYQLQLLAQANKVEVIQVQSNAKDKVRPLLEELMR